jgi:hypothetical protein
VTSDILGLKVLVSDAMKALDGRGDLPAARRKSLSQCFHRYIERDGVNRLRRAGISKPRSGLQNIAAVVVRREAADNASALLAAIDKFADAQLEPDDRRVLTDFLSRVNVALDRSRASIPVSRYL